MPVHILLEPDLKYFHHLGNLGEIHFSIFIIHPKVPPEASLARYSLC
jgi:hypothetical protein